jgi:hypothetical protein
MKLKNKDFIFTVMRSERDPKIHHVLCATTRTPEKAEELCGVYEQEMLDRGCQEGDYMFYVNAQTFYDE